MVECKGPNIERAKRDKVLKPLLSEINGKLGLKSCSVWYTSDNEICCYCMMC